MQEKLRMQEVTTLDNLEFLNPFVVDDLCRFGDKGDGGYLAPENAIRRSDTVVSFGIGDNWSFEKSLVDLNPNLIVHAYDPTISGEQFYWKFCKSIVKLFLRQETLSGVKKSWTLHRSYQNFFQGNVQHFRSRVSDRQYQPHFVTPDQVFSRVDNISNIVLKIDIEGGEYRIVEKLLAYKDKLNVIIIEFHETDIFRWLFTKQVALLSESFAIVHVHGNNFCRSAEDGLPIVLEITFQNKRFSTLSSRRNVLPIEGKDYPNWPDGQDFSLRFAD